MRFISYLLRFWILASSWATAFPSTSERRLHVHLPFHEIDLLGFETNSSSTAIEARKPVTICGTGTEGFHIDRCFTLANTVITLVLGVSGYFFVKSQNNNCSPLHVEKDGFNYALKAKGSCTTTAQRETIFGALEKYINEKLPDEVCGVQCMKLTHGGDWEGYLVFGKGDYDWDYWLESCSRVGKLGKCSTGGKSYIYLP